MKILVINPGSTSTKLGVYSSERPEWKTVIRHSRDELSVFECLIAQYDYRKQVILRTLEAEGIPLSFAAIMGRGGLVKPIPGGVYEVNDALRDALYGAKRMHASNLGGLLAVDLASMIPGCRAFIADPVVVDELDPVARISGSPLLPRISIFHALNHKAVARNFAREMGVPYESLNLIVCHLGGGVSVGAHKAGRVVDVNNALDGEGPFAPERAGTLPAGQLIDLCFSGEYTCDELKRMISGQAGLTAHLHTTDVPEIEDRIAQGDEHAKLILDAMIYHIAKAVGGAAVVLKGNVDAILLTGGMAYSEYVVSHLTEQVSFLAKVKVYPGEDEMEALATNGLRALSGELPIHHYTP